MKSTLLFLALCATITIHAQRVKSEKAVYQTIRLPLEPLDAGLAGYKFTVSTPYPEDNSALEQFAKERFEKENLNYDNLVEESKLLHQEALAQYEQDVITARENFKIESDEFSKMSFVERMALADKKPTLKLPSKPIYRKPSPPRYIEPNLSNSIVFKGEVLADSYLRLDGYDKADTNALEGQIVVYDFEKLDVTTEVKQESYYNKNAKKNMNRNVTYYVTEYKRPTELTLTYNGTTLYSGIFEGTGEFFKYNDKSRPNMFNLEKQSVSDVLIEINSYINNKYGMTPLNNSVNVKFVKNNKGEYDDLENAKDTALAAYANFDADSDNDQLRDAILIWEKAMEESNIEDRKARIDKGVTEAILFNLVEANIALKDMVKADEYLNKLKNMSLNYSEKQSVEAYEIQMASINERLLANGM
jgi:hypothetical protein